jgi:hypothetical protein
VVAGLSVLGLIFLGLIAWIVVAALTDPRFLSF